MTTNTFRIDRSTLRCGGAGLFPHGLWPADEDPPFAATPLVDRWGSAVRSAKSWSSAA